MKEKTVYNVTELAELFEVSRQTVHNWITEQHRFPNAYRAEWGGDTAPWLVPASDVEQARKEEAERLRKELARLGFRGVSA